MAELKVRARPGGQRINQAGIDQVVNGAGVRRDQNRRADRVAAYVRVSIPMRIGRLRASVQIEEPAAARPTVAVVVGRGVPYAGSYLFGARPHVITPRRGKALRFQAGGRVVYARRVNHPGNKPHPVLNEATRFWRP